MKTPQVPRWIKNLLMGILTILWISPKNAKADAPAAVSFQVFYDELMPYGDWVKDARYGYVWLPAVYDDFHPYGTNGHWVMTSYGNTWVSDYDWGWATFHYGRWYYDDNYRSWAWIPDYTWGPAWVDWRTGGGYYGWAPMGPGFSVSVRVNIPAFHWVFVPQNRFVYRNVYSYCVPRGRRVNIYNNTTIINHTVVYNNNKYYAGPPRREIERVTKRSYPERRLESSKAPGRTVASRNAVRAYRPDLQSARGTSTSARPSRVLSSGEARTQPTATPSRVNSRSESVSGRPATTTAGSSRSVQPATTPSRSNSTSKGSAFETKPYSGNQTRTTAPTNSRSTDSRTSAPASRSGSSRETKASPAQTRTQTVSPAQRSTQPRTQSAPAQRSTQTRTQPASSRPQSSSPTVKSAPAQTRKATPAPSRSSTTVKSSSGSRTAPASTSRSSSSSSSRSSSKTRGNN
ncbi:DUF6600 domain-containing protein [Algoriphagus sp. NG3]|uniref:DUF6600 domain-containing protein n=1 Tax=Algoriphagus sp. NG3 TaxID=3097546 RepID=UPI002A835522|nr:DUF6600 domain-containing protein [Algoriphagus sp. NG3]WPR75752.1 DUF6600 domain-containing protein [Algoriphagus sp. NG3]